MIPHRFKNKIKDILEAAFGAECESCDDDGCAMCEPGTASDDHDLDEDCDDEGYDEAQYDWRYNSPCDGDR